MHEINKIIARHSVKFYSKAWKHRNDIMHDLVKHTSFVIDQYKKIKDLILAENRADMKKYLRAQELDVKKCDTACIRHQNVSTLKKRKVIKEEKVSDIGFFVRDFY